MPNGAVLKGQIALAIWLVLRTRWSKAKFGPKAMPDFAGAHIQFLSLPGHHPLQQRFTAFLRDLGASIVETHTLEPLTDSINPRNWIAISYEWFAGQSPGYFWRVWKLWRLLRRAGAPVVTYAPDTIFFTLNIGYGLAVTAAQGRILMLQNTPAEAHKYGLPNVCGPVFWTWPREELDRWTESPVPWSDRRPLAVLAGTGEPKRLDQMKIVYEELFRCGWDVRWSDGTLGPDEYVRLMNMARISVTTSLTQEMFLHPLLSRWESATTVTGRVWEGFAARNAVVTNRASMLDFLGFKAGRDFLDLDEVLAQPDILTALSESHLKAIASHGHSHFLQCLSRW